MMIFLPACLSACCRTYSHIVFSIQNSATVHCMIYKARNRLSTTSCLSICSKQLAELIQQALHVLLLLTDLLHSCLLTNSLYLCVRFTGPKERKIMIIFESDEKIDFVKDGWKPLSIR